MQIVQNPKSGEVFYKLDRDEIYNVEEHLEALMEFVTKQAVDVHRLINSYRKIVGRLDELERKL